MRSVVLLLGVTLNWLWVTSSFATPPGEAKDTQVVSIGMQFDEAKCSLEAVNATKTEYDEARGYMPREPSDPPPPAVYLYMLDDKVRLEVVVDHDTNAIRTMVIRFEPEVRSHLKANYFETLCYAVTFHHDDTYSLRLKKNVKANNSSESKQGLSK